MDFYKNFRGCQNRNIGSKTRFIFCSKSNGSFRVDEWIRLNSSDAASKMMRYIRIENKEQAEAIDRLEFKIF